MHDSSIVIGHVQHVITAGLFSGSALHQLAGIADPQQLLLDMQGEIDIPVLADDRIVLKGGERFVIGTGNNPIADNPCLRHPIVFHLNGQPITPEQGFQYAKVSANEIRALDPHARDSDGVIVDIDGLADEPIKSEWRLILQKWYHFLVVPCGNVGLQGLLEQQVAQVQQAHPSARLETEGGAHYLVVPDFPLPGHWSQARVTLMVVLPNGYPMAPPDMFWVDPYLRLPNGAEAAGAQCVETHLGRQWQRFSWHYTDGQAWNPARSSLLSHIQFAKARLNQAM